jgi:hypothetical protein
MSPESNPARAANQDPFATVRIRVALDSYISPFKLLVLFYFHHPASIYDIFYEYRRFHFILFLYSIFSPSLNHAFSFLKARTEERVTRACIRCRISRVPREIWLHHFYCPLPWYTVFRCPYFPFIFIFPSLFPSTLWRLSWSSLFWIRILMNSRDPIPGQQRFHFVIMSLQYRLHHSDSDLGLTTPWSRDPEYPDPGHFPPPPPLFRYRYWYNDTVRGTNLKNNCSWFIHIKVTKSTKINP